MTFSEKVVLITGASSGIGAAIAVKFSEEGANVVIVGRNENKLNNISYKCSVRGKKPLSIVADLTIDADTRRVIDEVIKCYGKLNILINNAGTAESASILSENAMDVFDKTISVNLRSAIFLTHLAASYLIENKGNIVNLSSIGAYQTMFTSNFSYCVSKAALDHFTRNIAMELGAKGVRVNNVSPGPVKTEYFDKAFQNKEERDKMFDILEEASVLKRIAEPNEIADLVLYLASDRAKSVTGSSFVIDNGVMLNGVITKV